MSGQDTNETSPLLEEQNPLGGSEDLSEEERRKIANKRFARCLVGGGVLFILLCLAIFVPLLIVWPQSMFEGT